MAKVMRIFLYTNVNQELILLIHIFAIFKLVIHYTSTGGINLVFVHQAITVSSFRTFSSISHHNKSPLGGFCVFHTLRTARHHVVSPLVYEVVHHKRTLCALNIGRVPCSNTTRRKFAHTAIMVLSLANFYRDVFTYFIVHTRIVSFLSIIPQDGPKQKKKSLNQILLGN